MYISETRFREIFQDSRSSNFIRWGLGDRRSEFGVGSWEIGDGSSEFGDRRSELGVRRWELGYLFYDRNVYPYISQMTSRILAPTESATESNWTPIRFLETVRI